MYSTYLVIAMIALLFILATQLIRMNIYVIKMRKSEKINQMEIKEDTHWEFIKGLY